MISDLIFILIVIIISGFIGFLIAWFWRTAKHKNEIEDCKQSYAVESEKQNKQLAECQDNLKKNELLLSECEDRYENIKAENLKLRQDLEKSESIQKKEPRLNFDANAAKKYMNKNIKVNDLKIIEGIGPKIESILQQNGIDTWLKLSKADPEQIKKLLIEQGGERYRLHDPTTWPAQAQLAFEGKWLELKALQDKLDGGKYVS